MTLLRHQRGAAAVELGILMAVLLPLTFGTTELGRAIYQYNTLCKASRDAARYLSSQGPGDAADIAIAQCLAVYGNMACTGSVLAPGLTAAMVEVCDSSNCPGTHQNQPTGSGVINLVTVTINGYQFTPAVPFNLFGALNGATLDFSPISTTMRQIL